MTFPEVVDIVDDTRPAWHRDGPRPLRSTLWRPDRDARHSLVVLSHGSGGAANDLAWLAEALAAEGFLVAAVNHHGNSSEEFLLPEGATFWWERPPDLTVVVDYLQHREDVESVAVVGYSLGGYAAAAVLGARIDPDKLRRLLAGEPILPIPAEVPDIVDRTAALLAAHGPELVASRAVEDFCDPRFKAGVLLAPAICPILDEASLAAIDRPVLVRWGDADVVEVPEDNGMRYTRLIPGADGCSMGSQVGHYEFGDIPGGESVRAAVVADVLPFLREHLLGQRSSSGSGAGSVRRRGGKSSAAAGHEPVDAGDDRGPQR